LPHPLQRHEGEQRPAIGPHAGEQAAAAGAVGGTQFGSARLESIAISRIGAELLVMGSVEGIGDAAGAAFPSAGTLSIVGPSARATGPTATASIRTGTLPMDFQNPFFIAFTMRNLIAGTFREIGTPESRASQSTPKHAFDQRFDGNGGTSTGQYRQLRRLRRQLSRACGQSPRTFGR
jgi:hypothetical protein